MRGEPNTDVHIHNYHGPVEEREPAKPRFAAFTWVVIHRSDGKFAMVNEPAGIAGDKPRYWLPAGRVDAGEGALEAGRREALEEAGLEVEITGVLRFMFHDCPRVVVMAKPVPDDAPCKTVPDFESAGAIWVSAEDLGLLNNPGDYRAPDPVDFFEPIAAGSM